MAMNKLVSILFGDQEARLLQAAQRGISIRHFLVRPSHLQLFVSGDAVAVDHCLANGATGTLVDEMGATVAHHAAVRGHAEASPVNVHCLMTRALCKYECRLFSFFWIDESTAILRTRQVTRRCTRCCFGCLYSHARMTILMIRPATWGGLRWCIVS